MPDCYDKRLFLSFAVAVGSAPAYRPDNTTQIEDFISTIAPYARVAMQLRDATPVPVRLAHVLNATTTLPGVEVVAMRTSWGGVVTVVFTARPEEPGGI